MGILDKLRGRNPQSLWARLFSGGAWLGAGSGVEQGLRFVRNMILTRLLAPEAFGLMAIVLSVSHLLQVLTGIGVKEAVIQNPQSAEKTYLNGAWWLSLARSALLFVVAFLTAPLVATFYEEPALTALLRVGFASVLLQGANSPASFVALKRMKYGRWVLIQTGGGTLGVLTTILLAWRLQGVWALVLGYVAEAVYRMVLSFLLCPFRPGFQFKKEHLEALFRYARGIFGLPVLTLIYTEGATFVVGKLCAKDVLGIFAMALALARIPSLVGKLLVDLLMPAFSEVQHDPQRVNRALLRVTSLTVFLCLPALAFVSLYGEELLILAYGPKYVAGATALALLFANEILLTCNVPLATVYYMSLGQPALMRWFSLLRAILLAVMIYPAVKWFGLAGAAAAPLLAMAISYWFQLVRMRTLTGLEVRPYVGIFLRGALLTLPCGIVWAGTETVLSAARPWVTLLAAAVGCGTLYAAGGWWVWQRGKARELLGPLLGENRAA